MPGEPKYFRNILWAVRPLQTSRPMRSLALVATVLLVACDPADPPPDPAHDPVALTGTYQVASQFTVPATVAAPGPLGDSLRLLRDLSDNPARALLDMAEMAGVPGLDILLLALPSSLASWRAG